MEGYALWLVNAPATFQRAMCVALRGCEEFTAVYLDDILIFSADRAAHFSICVKYLQRWKRDVITSACQNAYF